jgi:hypothetical protein
LLGRQAVEDLHHRIRIAADLRPLFGDLQL